MAAIDKMLLRLDTDYIDLLLQHQQFGDYLGAWSDMEKAVKEGKVKSIGLSNFESERLEEVLSKSQIKPSVLQVECHQYYQQNALKERIAPYGTVIESWYPLGHGNEALLNEALFDELANKYNKTSAQIILRWHMQEGVMISYSKEMAVGMPLK
jgi:diketogulonate reductase-like aldo/keto reductase